MKTLAQIIHSKTIAYFEARTIRDIKKDTRELLFGLILGAFIIAPDKIITATQNASQIGNFAPIKIFFLIIVFKHRKFLIKFAKKIFFGNPKKKLVANSEDMIDSIPVIELVDYLVKNAHFKREGINGVRQTFGLNMDRYNQLAQRLEKNGVLVRGENNCRILADFWTRQTLFDYLSGKINSKDLVPKITIRRIGEGAKIRMQKNELLKIKT